MKKSMKKHARLALLAAAICCGLVLLAGCSDDDVADTFGIDTDEDVDLQLDTLVIDNTRAAASASGTTSIQAELDKEGYDAGELADITDVDFRYLEIMYRNASWSPGSVTSITLTLSISGALGSATLAQTVVNTGTSGWNRVSIDPADRAVLVKYLNDFDQPFTYTATTSAEPTSVYVEVLVEIGATVDLEL